MVDKEERLRKQIEFQKKKLEEEKLRTELIQERRSLKAERVKLRKERSSGIGGDFIKGAGLVGRGTLQIGKGFATFAQRVSQAEEKRIKTTKKVTATQKKVKKILKKRKKKVKKVLIRQRRRVEEFVEPQPRGIFDDIRSADIP